MQSLGFSSTGSSEEGVKHCCSAPGLALHTQFSTLKKGGLEGSSPQEQLKDWVVQLPGSSGMQQKGKGHSRRAYYSPTPTSPCPWAA